MSGLTPFSREVLFSTPLSPCTTSSCVPSLSLSCPPDKMQCNAISHFSSSIHCGDLWTIQDLSVGQSFVVVVVVYDQGEIGKLKLLVSFQHFMFYNLLELPTWKEEMSFLYFGKVISTSHLLTTRYLKMIKVLKCTLEFIVVLELLHPYPLFERACSSFFYHIQHSGFF